MLSHSLLLDLAAAADLAALKSKLVEAGNALGFGLMTSSLIRGDLRSGRAWVQDLTNAPPGFLAAQLCLADALRDPVMTHMRTRSVPIGYDQRTYVEAGAGDLWEEQAPWGYRTGIASSLHEASHMESFMLGFDRDEPLPIDEGRRMEIVAKVHLLTIYAHSAMQRLLTPKPEGAPSVPLEKHEADCLRWTAEGRTVTQIGSLARISESDVVTSRNRAAGKLGAPNVYAAALRCIEGGRSGH